VNVGEAILNFNRFDLLFLLFLFGMFVLGFMQGTIRRLLGLGAMAFSFLFAASLTNVVGPFLAENWNQFPNEYAVMLGFLIVFVASNVAFTLIIQAFYHRQPLFAKYTFLDEALGVILGIVQGMFLVGCLIVILDSYFLIPGAPQSGGELPFPPNPLAELVVGFHPPKLSGVSMAVQQTGRLSVGFCSVAI